MSPVKLSVLAFAGAALATPYHGQNHAHFHHSKHAHAASSYGSSSSDAAPYPIANGTYPAAGPTGSGVATYTSTNTNFVTITSTVEFGPSGTGYGSGASVGAAGYSTDCSEDVTVTTKVYETVTVTPGSSSSPVAPAETSSESSSSSSSLSSSSSSSSSVSISLTYSEAGKGHSWHKPSSTYEAPSSSSSSSSSSSEYIAPSPTSTYIAPITTSSSSVYIAPTTSSSSAAAPSSTYSTGTGTGKRGVAYNDASLTDCFKDSPQISWGYNWGSDSSGLTGFKYIPMLWSPRDDFLAGWDSNANAALSSGSDTLFSFNEPDMSTQANMSPEEAADAYRQYMMPYADKAKLCAPSVTNGGGEMGLTWLSNFMSACSDCQIDCVNIHWYADASLTDYFKTQVQNATDVSGGKPVYLTEFGTTGGDTNAFLEDVMPWMDSQDFVQGYSYFMVSDGMLVDGTEPSSYGTTYADYTG